MADNKWLRNSFVWVIIMVAMLVLFFTFVGQPKSNDRISITQVANDVKAGKVARIVAHEENNEITVYENPDPGGKVYTAIKQPEDPLSTQLIALGVAADRLPDIKIEGAAQWQGYIGILGFLLPTLILVGVFVFMMRQAQGTNNQALSFGKSRARLFTGNKPTITFADVAGVEEAKQELAEVVEFLKYPDKFNALGARIPAACCSWALPAPARRCSPAPWQARQACPSSPSAARSSWRCSSASARAACATCSTRPSATAPASSSWTKSTRSAASAAPASAARTTSASRR